MTPSPTVEVAALVKGGFTVAGIAMDVAQENEYVFRTAVAALATPPMTPGLAGAGIPTTVYPGDVRVTFHAVYDDASGRRRLSKGTAMVTEVGVSYDVDLPGARILPTLQALMRVGASDVDAALHDAAQQDAAYAAFSDVYTVDVDAEVEVAYRPRGMPIPEPEDNSGGDMNTWTQDDDAKSSSSSGISSGTATAIFVALGALVALVAVLAFFLARRHARVARMLRLSTTDPDIIQDVQNPYREIQMNTVIKDQQLGDSFLSSRY